MKSTKKPVPSAAPPRPLDPTTMTAVRGGGGRPTERPPTRSASHVPRPPEIGPDA